MEFTLTILNFFYAFGGAILALILMIVGYRLFDKITPFDTSTELAGGNVAVGIVIGSIFIGLGISIGLAVGMGLN